MKYPNINDDEAHVPDLNDWAHLQGRGALVKTGDVFQSSDRSLFLRTGEPEVIHSEAEFSKQVWDMGFPVPQVVGVGYLPNGLGYYSETSVGKQDFGQQLRDEYGSKNKVSNGLFLRYTEIVLKFLRAQLRSDNRPSGASQLRGGIQLANVLEENPDIDPSLLNNAVDKAETRVGHLPLVLSHGDLTPFNVMDEGIIDFEHRFIAPFGYDAITAVIFQRFWDHPQPDWTGTMKRWEFSDSQLKSYFQQVDRICEEEGIHGISEFHDDFILLKSIWALSYEKTVLRPERWEWRRRVAVYCIEQFLAEKPIDSLSFRRIGLAEALNRSTFQST